MALAQHQSQERRHGLHAGPLGLSLQAQLEQDLAQLGADLLGLLRRQLVHEWQAVEVARQAHAARQGHVGVLGCGIEPAPHARGEAQEVDGRETHGGPKV